MPRQSNQNILVNVPGSENGLIRDFFKKAYGRTPQQTSGNDLLMQLKCSLLTQTSDYLCSSLTWTSARTRSLTCQRTSATLSSSRVSIFTPTKLQGCHSGTLKPLMFTGLHSGTQADTQAQLADTWVNKQAVIQIPKLSLRHTGCDCGTKAATKDKVHRLWDTLYRK